MTNDEFGREALAMGVSLSMMFEFGRYLLSALWCVAPGAGQDDMIGKKNIIMTKLMKRHFSDGVDTISDRQAFIRDVFAAANKILQGEEP